MRLERWAGLNLRVLGSPGARGGCSRGAAQCDFTKGSPVGVDWDVGRQRGQSEDSYCIQVGDVET